jgi:hypothetical protein
MFRTGVTSDSDISPAKALRTPSSETYFFLSFLCALGVFAGNIPDAVARVPAGA